MWANLSAMASAVLYVRISELTDATTSPERQRSEGLAYAETAGHDVVDQCEDLDVSGRLTIDNRPGLSAALDLIERGEAQVLIVARLDRLARSVVEFHKAVQRVEAVGGSVVSVAEGLDFGSPAGRMVASVLASFAQYESELIGQRVTSAKRHLKEVGKWGGGRRPFGWRPEQHESGKGYVLKLDDVESAALREMAADVLAGKPLNAIASELNSRGITTVLGKPWASGHSVRQVLCKRALLGAEGAEPLLAPDEYARLQAVLDKRREPIAPRDDLNPVLLPSTLITCGQCGAPMKRGTAGKNGKAWTTYRCSSRPPAGESGCYLLASAARVDETVEAEVLNGLGRVELAFPGEGELVDPAADTRAELEAGLSRLEQDRYNRGVFDGDEERYVTIHADMSRRLSELPEPYQTSAGRPEIPTGPRVAEVWEQLDLATRREILEAVLDAVTIAPGERGRRFDRSRVNVHWNYGGGPTPDD